MLKIVTESDKQFKKAHSADAGWDILANETVVVPARGRKTIGTGLRVAIPEGWVGLIKERSGLATKHNISIGAGVIDSGYTGECKVCFINHGDSDYKVKEGAKIAQMLVLPIFTGEVLNVDSLEETERGEQGFNSTGY